ncbi:MAG: DUF2157 domain-containing protein [Bacteroidia bacterium]|nr:DUF2157 domain-containing protein [Bacteroidia bacterium]
MLNENTKINRSLLHILAKHSQWREESVKDTMQKTALRPGLTQWLFFLDYIFLALGGILFVCGLFFFFAYNWDEMPRMVKLGFTQLPVAVLGIYLIVKKTDTLAGKITLTALSCLIGLAFAVYGQIYQTGATAFDFLKGWAILAFVWVAISSFPPLWFLYLVLLNLTMMTWIEQFHTNIQTETASLYFFGINFIAFLLFEMLNRFRKELDTHRWFPQIVSAFILLILSMNVSAYILNEYFNGSVLSRNILLGLSAVLFPLGFYYFYHIKKEIAMVGLIPFAVICLIAIFIGHQSGGEDIFTYLTIGGFVVIACGFLISFLTKFKKHLNEADNTESSQTT